MFKPWRERKRKEINGSKCIEKEEDLLAACIPVCLFTASLPRRYVRALIRSGSIDPFEVL